jgi:hypothetical protein
MDARAKMRRTLTLGAAAVAIGFPAAAQTQADRGLATEARLAAKYPGLIKRSGNTLRIGRNSFTDKDCRNENTNCTRWRADAIYGKWVGVSVDYYEQSEYFLVDPNGLPTNIGAPPISSPSGKRFFVLYEDPHEWNPLQGAAVWNWAGLQRLRVVDPALVEVDRFVAWRGDSCVELVGRGRYPAPEHPVWLAEQDGDWHLSRKRPAICTG